MNQALLALGPLLLLAHGWVDFVLRNPAVVGLAAGLAVLSVSLARPHLAASAVP